MDHSWLIPFHFPYAVPTPVVIPPCIYCPHPSLPSSLPGQGKRGKRLRQQGHQNISHIVYLASQTKEKIILTKHCVSVLPVSTTSSSLSCFINTTCLIFFTTQHSLGTYSVLNQDVFMSCFLANAKY